MNHKKVLEKRLRGWLPQTPNLLSQSKPIEMPKKPTPLAKRKLSGLQVIAVTMMSGVYTYSMLFQLSSVRLSLLIVTLVFAIAAFSFQKSKQRIFKFLKFGLILVILIMTILTGLGFYLFYTSGYPPTYVPKISYLNILDASITQYLKSVEESASYRFLQAEHFGNIIFTGFTLSSESSNAPGGRGGLKWTLYAKDVNVKITMGQSEGSPYYTNTGNLLRNVALSQNYPSAEKVRESLGQIDALGLRWFHDQALEAYQNTTGTTPSITVLGVDIEFNSLKNYQGITIILNGRYMSRDNFGNKVYPSVFTVQFEPTGNILSVKT